jgi:CheY-like chemotaxis protein
VWWLLLGVLMRARILVLQEEDGPVKEIQECCGVSHELIYIGTSKDALKLMAQEKIDLIISRVHLEKSNIFVFLRLVKTDPKFRHIPFICYSGHRNYLARTLDPILAQSCKALGADRYISVEDYRHGFTYDLNKIKQDIESCLNQPHH